MQILNFMGPREETNNWYKKFKIDKLKNIIANCQFIYDQLKHNLPRSLSNFFNLNTQLQKLNTRKNRLTVPQL